ncbi:hypothetical protein BJI67_08080 [Acidihalobacter aeolianus]|uniref:Diguanylate cyclase n=2 Tax=Acidihalobacter aeolianus TaxID=2792603 RepID=A0A1D8K7W4_9GAMM|nr:hypothetical protein BJI67_08080 [Acidihalobacter aeolianus]
MTCARLVEGADLPLAWIGIQQGTHMRVRAVSGTARGYVDGLELDMAEGSPTAQGPVGQAVHHANTIVIADLQRDGSFILWQQRAAHYGLRSLVAVPFTTEAGDPGVLAAYAQQADYFSAPLIQLMEELAGDVALGVNQFDHLQAITRLSQQDPLTGLPNRAYFMRALKQAIGRTDRADRLTGIGILDLDYFKQINDSLGHHIGDMVITHLATELNQAVRQGDTVARLGGDEFGILLEGIADAEELDHIASRLLAAVRKPICIEGIEAALKTDASLGLTLYPFDGGTPADLLRHADAALYAVKGSGRHRWQLFHRDMASLAKQEYLIHQRMPAALLENRLIFYFQPQINLQTGEIIGIEALIRWQDPVSGMWMPKAFMPVVEADTGLSRSLGCYCLNAAAMAITRWLSDGLAFGRLSVNICARHLQHSGFLEDLSSVLLRYPVVAEHLSIELTETQALADLDKSARMLSEVRALGVHVDLDDFGSGYASLQYVRELPLDTIKLDLQFVQNLEHDTEALSVGYAALSLAEMHGAEVIAEGVETERIARLWQRLGGRVIQGYLGAKPMPESELIAWLSAYAPDRRFATTPHWRSTPEVLTLLQALPFHSQYIARLRGAMTESPLSSDTLNGLVKTWRAPCPITEWLSSTDAIPYDTVALKQAHDHLHESIGSIINALSSDPSSHGDVEGLEKAWDHFREALDRVIEQIDRRLYAQGAQADS